MIAALLALSLFAAQPAERVVDVRVQGNTITPEADVVRMAAVAPGTEVTPALIEALPATLQRAGHFRHVEVLMRYGSIADPSQIVLIIVVDEGPVTIKAGRDGEPARAVKRRVPPMLILPILGSDDGYGFTYGALVSVPNIVGRRTRLSVPLTWGGERRAQAEFEVRLPTERLTRLRVGGAWLRRDNRALSAIDERQQVSVRAEREIARALRVAAWSGVDQVRFGGVDSHVLRGGAEAAVDTRVDPVLSRNAVYVRGAVEQLAEKDGATATRTLVDANAYLGLVGPATLLVRAYRDGTDRPAPGYLKVLLGRDGTLRGVRAASAAADTTAAGTLELRVPLTSPLSVGKLGVRAFIDAAAAYDAGLDIRRQRFERGIGGGVWFAAAVIRLGLDVAHSSTGSTRVFVSSGTAF